MRVLPLLLLATAAVPAQDQDSAVIKVDVNLVNVLCTVRNKNGGLVGNLEKQDFTLLEDGKQQEIKYFTRETDLPLTWAAGGRQRQPGAADRNRAQRAAQQFFTAGAA